VIVGHYDRSTYSKARSKVPSEEELKAPAHRGRPGIYGDDQKPYDKREGECAEQDAALDLTRRTPRSGYLVRRARAGSELVPRAMAV
jgi:hypothetical protein